MSIELDEKRKTIVVNNLKFEKYELETLSNFKTRIAVFYKTLPIYVNLTEISPNNYKSLTIQEALTSIITENNILGWFEHQTEFPDLKLKNLAYLYWYYKYTNIEKKSKHILLTFSENILKQLNVDLDYTSFDNSYPAWKDSYEEAIQSLTKMVEVISKDFETLGKLQSVESSKVLELQVVTKVVFTVNYDIYELFNTIKMSRDIPFTFIGEYYKILKEFIPPKEWRYITAKTDYFSGENDVLVLKVLNVKNEPLKNKTVTDRDLYSTITIYFESPRETKRRELIQLSMEKKRLLRETYQKNQEKLDSSQEIKTIKRRKQDDVTASAPRIRNEQKTEELDEDAKKDREYQKMTEEEKEEMRKVKKDLEFKREQEKKRNELEQELDNERDLQLRKQLDELDRNKDYTPNSHQVFMIIESPIHPDLNERELINRVLRAFPSDIENETVEQIEIKADFIIPDFNLDRILFLDMTMNDPLISKFMIVDEHLKIRKDKSSMYIHIALDPYTKDLETYISCIIQEQIITKTNKIQGRFPRKLQEDNFYITVYMNKGIVNLKMANEFKELFCRLLAYYNTKKEAVIRKYQNYINIKELLTTSQNQLKEKLKPSTKTKTMLKEFVPELFKVKNYTKFCPHPPRIVDDEKEVKELEDQGFLVMKFPKDIDTDLTPQRNYVCDKYPQYKYPGFIVHNFDNKKTFPILPCCYNQNSKDKDGSVYSKYYDDEKATLKNFDLKKNENKKYVITSNKIVNPKQRGYPLVEDIDMFLSTMFSGFKYCRYGVNKSVNSVLQVLTIALNDLEDWEGKTIKATTKTFELTEIRKNLITFYQEENIGIFQESYLYNNQTIIQYLEDENKYLDVKLFIRLLESYFNCYIYIFSQNEEYPRGILSAPYYLKEYLSYEQNEDRPYVLIYEHFGNRADNTNYPHYELIEACDAEKTNLDKLRDEDFYTSFSNANTLISNLRKNFDIMYQSKPSFIFPFKSRLRAQATDYYGKARFLQFSFFSGKRHNISVLTDPLPPRSSVEEYKFYKSIEEELALEFLKIEGILEWKYVNTSDKTVGIKFRIEGINCYIPIKTTYDRKGEQDLQAPSSLTKESSIDEFVRLSSLARYLCEYTFYLFSKYSINHPFDRSSLFDNYLLNFMKDNLIIDPEFKYGDIPRTFSLTSGCFSGGKLVVPNLEVYKKLLYTLRLKIRDNFSDLINYSTYKYIQNYFVDIRDYKQAIDYVILYGQEALIKWIDNKKIDYTLYNEIIPTVNNSLYYQFLDRYGGTDEELTKLQDKLFVILFTASWCKPCKGMENRIYERRRLGKNKFADLTTSYINKVNFVFIDIDKNPGLKTIYQVTRLPYIMIMKIAESSLEVIDTLESPKGDPKSIVFTMTHQLRIKLDHLLNII